MSDSLATTVVPLDGQLGNGEVGVLLDAPPPELHQVEDRLLTADEWSSLRLARPEHYSHHAGLPRMHVDRAQGGEGGACERCRHAAHVAPRQGRRA